MIENNKSKSHVEKSGINKRTFSISEKVTVEKISFKNRFGITVVLKKSYR